MARNLPLCYNCHMNVGKINSILHYKKALGVDHLIKSQRNPKIELPEAYCKTQKELALDYGYPADYFNHLALHVRRLESNVKGGGTRAIKKVVRESLKDPQTNGRVTLVATTIREGDTHPFYFYRKLGFRTITDYYEEMGQKGKPMYEDALVMMYLPKENINHCLNYKNSVDPEQIGLTYAYGKRG